MEIGKPSRRRRNHTEEFKRAVIAACCEAGASVAGIALATYPSVRIYEAGSGAGIAAACTVFSRTCLYISSKDIALGAKRLDEAVTVCLFAKGAPDLAYVYVDDSVEGHVFALEDA